MPLPGTPQNYTANPSQPFNFPTPPTPLHLPPTPHNQQLTSSPQLSSTSNQQLTSPPQLSSTSNQQLLDTSGGDGQNLLRTPTRNPNRSAGDVLMDIGTMLADLTDELDTMLQLDKNWTRTLCEGVRKNLRQLYKYSLGPTDKIFRLWPMLGDSGTLNRDAKTVKIKIFNIVTLGLIKSIK